MKEKVLAQIYCNSMVSENRCRVLMLQNYNVSMIFGCKIMRLQNYDVAKLSETGYIRNTKHLLDIPMHYMPQQRLSLRLR